MSEPNRHLVDESPYITDDARLAGETHYRNGEGVVPTPPMAPDPLYTELRQFFEELLPLRGKRVTSTTAKIPIFANMTPKMIVPADDNRIRARVFTDNNNTQPVLIAAESTSDTAASIWLAPDADWFRLYGTNAHYATTTADGYLYVVVDRQG